ncbi:MAG: hypothetical protein ACR2NK_04165 [Mariniblastus sp.]
MSNPNTSTLIKKTQKPVITVHSKKFPAADSFLITQSLREKLIETLLLVSRYPLVRILFQHCAKNFYLSLQVGTEPTCVEMASSHRLGFESAMQ